MYKKSIYYDTFKFQTTKNTSESKINNEQALLLVTTVRKENQAFDVQVKKSFLAETKNIGYFFVCEGGKCAAYSWSHIILYAH